MNPAVFVAAGTACVGAGLWLRVPPVPSSSRTIVGKERHFELSLSLTDQERLDLSVGALRSKNPDLVADHTLSAAQKRTFLLAATVLLIVLTLATKFLLITLLSFTTIVYLAALFVRLRLFQLGLGGKGLVSITDEDAKAFPDDRLPRYTVLVPAFRETEVFHRLAANLRALDYPDHLLEILLLLEADDHETIAAAEAAVGISSVVSVLRVPAAEPRTKPKALNFGLTLAHGDLITIYDAEDRPEPLQLRKAAMAFETAPPEVVCFQAKLDFFNPEQNILTKWFTLEYRMWFNDLLPGLAQMDAPIPLGGTSNHFRRTALVELGAWDPFNVTEDADLGLRLHRQGLRSGVLDSTTLEEANSDFINWIKQRSRWYKGYAQTLLVHLRHPVTLYREIGFQSFLLMCLFVGGTPLLAILNPFFWGLTLLWFVAHPAAIAHVFPAFPYFIGLVSWIIGNFLVGWSWLLSSRDTGKGLTVAAILSPVYWVIMSLAALKAGIQLVTAPSFWEKTHHGLDNVGTGPEVSPSL